MNRRAIIASLAAGVLLLTGCTSFLPGEATSPADSGGGPATTTTPAGVPVTCDTLIPRDLVAEFEGLGWEARSGPFTIGPHELSDGITCTWVDASGGSAESLQMYGWSPISDDESTQLQEYLQGEGWTLETESGVTYLSEPHPQPSWADEDGYGMTYAFSPGQVMVADTRASIAVIVWRA